MRIGIDMDMVLCDFYLSFSRLIREKFNREMPEISDTAVSEWDFYKTFVNPGEAKRLWEIVEDSSTKFWEGLAPLPGAVPALIRLCSGIDDVYFVTTRHGRCAKRQSEMWLCRTAKVSLPTVLIADSPEHKGDICAALQLTHFVDDRVENCEMARVYSPATSVYIIDRNYNHDTTPEGVERVGSFADFVSAIKG